MGIYGVIHTVGKDITEITPVPVLVIEFESLATVLLTSKLGPPISSTQYKIGSIIFAGLLKKSPINSLKKFRRNCFIWFVTDAIASIFSIFVTYSLKYFFN
uniref:Sulfate_transp domain-containing protein n=1 Tax=Strongyloides papillosus TaxID=174720 RepID=A0A0N5CFZ1_STREA